jgi:hypothetical protein
MDTQQIMELLLTMNEKMATKEDRKIDKEEMIAKMEYNTKTSQQGMLSIREEMIAKMDSNTKATLATKEEMKADREQRRAEMEEILAKMDGKASPEMMTATQAKTDVKHKELT